MTSLLGVGDAAIWRLRCLAMSLFATSLFGDAVIGCAAIWRFALWRLDSRQCCCSAVLPCGNAAMWQCCYLAMLLLDRVAIWQFAASGTRGYYAVLLLGILLLVDVAS